MPLVLDIQHEKLPEAEAEVQRRADNSPIVETIDNNVSETRRKDQNIKNTESLPRKAYLVLCELSLCFFFKHTFVLRIVSVLHASTAHQ